MMVCFITAKVQNVTVEFLNSTSVKVSWDRLDIPKITRYVVYYTTQRQVESTLQVIATASSVVINNTTINGIFTYQVAAQVVLDGVVIIGSKSDRNTLVVISDPSFNESNEDHSESYFSLLINLHIVKSKYR